MLREDLEAAMRVALDEAGRAPPHEDVPVGAVLLDPNGELVASAHNRVEVDSNPTAHAEMLVLATAATAAGTPRLTGHTLVVTLEPCAMCAMAAVWARVESIVYAADDPKAGAAWSLYAIPQDERLNHRCSLQAGILASESSALLTEFFAVRRSPDD